VLLVALVIVIWDRRHRFARGQVFALYLMGYTLGRFFIELMRTDPAEIVLGQRVNVWVSVAIFALGLVLYLWRGARADYPPRGAAHLVDLDAAASRPTGDVVTRDRSSH